MLLLWNGNTFLGGISAVLFDLIKSIGIKTAGSSAKAMLECYAHLRYTIFC